MHEACLALRFQPHSLPLDVNYPLLYQVVVTVMEDEVEEEEVGVVVEEVEVVVDQEVVVEVDVVVLEEGVVEVMTGKILCFCHFCILFLL